MAQEKGFRGLFCYFNIDDWMGTLDDMSVLLIIKVSRNLKCSIKEVKCILSGLRVGVQNLLNILIFRLFETMVLSLGPKDGDVRCMIKNVVWWWEIFFFFFHCVTHNIHLLDNNREKVSTVFVFKISYVSKQVLVSRRVVVLVSNFGPRKPRYSCQIMW